MGVADAEKPWPAWPKCRKSLPELDGAKMMKIKRQSLGSCLEPWLDWHKRSLAAARDLAIDSNIEVFTSLQDKKSKCAGHVIRLGCKAGESHVCKFLVAWRPFKWWRDQQIFNLTRYETLFYPFGWGQPRKWENYFHHDCMIQSFDTY